ncbi:cyclic nucleotide-binding domain-containing protein [Fusobacteria bacterium ZRK30]|nr:cyclic nucleotide-binding domain-containing protein [Fusobacteria bacterium ZRK30]
MKKIHDIKKLKFYIEKVNMSHIFKPNAIDHLELHCFEQGESIYFTQDRCKYLHILVYGKVKIFLLNNEGNFMLLDFSKPYDFIGDVEFIQQKNIYHNVEAIIECLLIAIPISKIHEITISDELYRLLSQSVSDKLIKTSKKFSQVILYPIKNRLVTCLIEISDKDKINNFKTQEIADYLGVTPRHVRRILSELYTENIIEKEGQSIHILNKKLLYKYAIKE